MSDGTEYDLALVALDAAAGRAAAEVAATSGERIVRIERPTPTNHGAARDRLRDAAALLGGLRARQIFGLRAGIRPGFAPADLLDAPAAEPPTDQPDRLVGRPRFADAHTVVVETLAGPRTIRAARIIVIPAGRPGRPPSIPFDDARVFDTDTVLGLRHLPANIVIAGGTERACAYAAIFQMLGVEVLLAHPRPGVIDFPDDDDDAVTALGAALADSGVRTVAAGAIGAARVEADRVVSRFADGLEIASEALLYAGPPDLDWAGAPEGVVRAADPSPRAVADAAGLDASTIPLILRTVPELATVGDTRRPDTVVGRCQFADSIAGQITGDKHGFVKLFFAENKLIGATNVGERASDWIDLARQALGKDLDSFDPPDVTGMDIQDTLPLAAADARSARTLNSSS